MEGECYYRYTLLAIIGSLIGLVLFVTAICWCVNYYTNPRYHSGSTFVNHHESILGDQFRNNPTFISDLQGIGKSAEQDPDLSLVSESNHGAVDLDDSIRPEDMFESNNSRRNSILKAKRK